MKLLIAFNVKAKMMAIYLHGRSKLIINIAYTSEVFYPIDIAADIFLHMYNTDNKHRA